MSASQARKARQKAYCRHHLSSAALEESVKQQQPLKRASKGYLNGNGRGRGVATRRLWEWKGMDQGKSGRSEAMQNGGTPSQELLLLLLSGLACNHRPAAGSFYFFAAAKWMARRGRRCCTIGWPESRRRRRSSAPAAAEIHYRLLPWSSACWGFPSLKTIIALLGPPLAIPPHSTHQSVGCQLIAISPLSPLAISSVSSASSAFLNHLNPNHPIFQPPIRPASMILSRLI
jgi:hypothetical protein